MPLIFAGVFSLVILVLLIIKIKTIWIDYKLQKTRLAHELAKPKRRGKTNFTRKSLRRV